MEAGLDTQCHGTLVDLSTATLGRAAGVRAWVDARDRNVRRLGGGAGRGGGAAALLVEGRCAEDGAADRQKPGAVRRTANVAASFQLPDLEYY